jgi:hypothetical protein
VKEAIKKWGSDLNLIFHGFFTLVAHDKEDNLTLLNTIDTIGT